MINHMILAGQHHNTHRNEVAMENDSVVSDVESSNSWLDKGVCADNPVLLQLNLFPWVHRREGKIGRSICGKLKFGLYRCCVY